MSLRSSYELSAMKLTEKGTLLVYEVEVLQAMFPYGFQTTVTDPEVEDETEAHSRNIELTV